MSRVGRVARRGGASALVAGALLLGPAALPAAAHGGAGDITLTAAEPREGDAAELEVCVTFVLDGEQADTARVTATAEGPGGATVPATAFAVSGEPGSRSGSLAFPEPGSWTVTITSTFPPGELVVPVSVGGGGPLIQPGAAGEGDCGPPTIAAASNGSIPSTSTTSTASSSASDPTAAPSTATTVDDGDGYQGSGVWLLVTGLLVAAFVSVGVVLERRHRASPRSDD